MVRRLEIAQSRCTGRGALLDEPTVGLDPMRATLSGNIWSICGPTTGTTLSSPPIILEEAQTHCDRIAIMHLGKRDALGTCQETRGLIGGGVHTLDEVFVHYAGSALGFGGNFRAVSAERATGPAPWLAPTL